MDAIEAADLKTLAWARPDMSDDALDRLMAHQRALVEVLEAAADLDPTERLARGRREAEARTGIDAGSLESLAAAIRAFCARRGSVRLLDRRRKELAGSAGPKARAQAEAVDEEWARLTDLSGFEARFGKEGLARLLAREDALLELHERLRALGES